MPDTPSSPEQFRPPQQEQQPQQQPQPTVEADLPTVPKQYEGLPSEIVEELWVKKEYIDPDKNRQETERRENVLAELRRQEAERVTQETTFLDDSVKRLPEDRKPDYEQGLKDAPAMLGEYFQGGRELPIRLSPEEQQLLDKMSALYKDAKQKNPDQPVTFQFSKAIDMEVYSNLQKRIGLEVVSAKSQVKDKEEANRLRQQLELPAEPYEAPVMSVAPQEANPSFSIQEGQEENTNVEKKETNQLSGNEASLNRLSELLAERVKRRPELAKSMIDLLEKMRQENDTKKISNTLVNELYQGKRKADYPPEPDYADAWDLATQDQGLPAKKENGWIYRGNFASKERGETTQTRGSLNIKVTPEAVRDLDDLIKKGVIKGNYKFGDPGTPAAGTDRHDSVTMYFLEKPDQNALNALSEVARKHYRGNDLLGQKVSEGFYMSEVGSISDQQAEGLLNQLEASDPELSKGIRQFLTNKDGRVAMSEAQFYAAKDTLDLYGLDLNYDATKGISITSKQK